MGCFTNRILDLKGPIGMDSKGTLVSEIREGSTKGAALSLSAPGRAKDSMVSCENVGSQWPLIYGLGSKQPLRCGSLGSQWPLRCGSFGSQQPLRYRNMRSQWPLRWGSFGSQQPLWCGGMGSQGPLWEYGIIFVNVLTHIGYGFKAIGCILGIGYWGQS